MLISEFQQKPAANLYDLCDAYRLWDVTFAPSASKIARGVAIRDIASKLQLMTRIRCPFARKVISKVIDTWFPNAGVCVCVCLSCLWEMKTSRRKPLGITNYLVKRSLVHWCVGAMNATICTGQPHGCRKPQLPSDADAQTFGQRRWWRAHQCQCEIMWNQIVAGHDMNYWMLVLRYQGSARSFDAHDLLLAHIHSESFGPWHPVPAMEMTMTRWHGHVWWKSGGTDLLSYRNILKFLLSSGLRAEPLYGSCQQKMPVAGIGFIHFILRFLSLLPEFAHWQFDRPLAKTIHLL